MVKISGIQNPQIRFVSPQINPSSKGIVASHNNSISFGNDDGNNEEGKKKGLSVKKLTNVLGTVLGLGIIGASAIYMTKRPKWMKLQGKQKALETKITAEANKYKDAIEINKGIQKKGGFLYNLGHKTNAIVDKVGEELSNNLLYGIGTVCIMPLVILFSPFGKKNSSKEDKKYAVLRQPLSFATMFSIQLTNDKVFKRWTNSIMDQNMLESDEVKKAIKDKKIDTVLDKVKYAEGELKKFFEKEADEILSRSGKEGLKAEEKNVLYKMKNAEMQHKQLEEYLNGRNLSKSNIDEILKHFDRFAKAAGNKKLVGESLKIASNVIVSQFIGCTLLNVIYGKVMKHAEQNKQQTITENELRDKVDALYNAKKAEGSVA